jgi:hypothetical protein
MIIFVLLFRPIKEGPKPELTVKSILKLLFERFPKFVVGFFIVAGILSGVGQSQWQITVLALCNFMSSWFETVGFVCIGLNIKIAEMATRLGVKKLILFYLCAQLIDIFITGLLAYYGMKGVK